MTCDDVVRGLSVYVDGEAHAVLAFRIREHLAGCAECRRRHRFERAFVTVVRSRLADVSIPAGLRRRIQALVSPL